VTRITIPNLPTRVTVGPEDAFWLTVRGR
jgi:hypothetical protein